MAAVSLPLIGLMDIGFTETILGTQDGGGSLDRLGIIIPHRIIPILRLVLDLSTSRRFRALPCRRPRRCQRFHLQARPCRSRLLESLRRLRRKQYRARLLEQ